MEPLKPLSDALKVEFVNRWGATIKAQGWSYRQTLVHLGSYYGQLGQYGYSEENVIRIMDALVQSWVDNTPAPPEASVPPLAHIGNNEIIELSDKGLPCIPEWDEAGTLDFGVQFGQRVQAGASWARAYYACGEWLVYWGTRQPGWSENTNPWAITPEPGGDHDPIIGELRADYEQGTRDDGGQRLVVLCHAGDLLARMVYDEPAVMGFLDQIRNAGYQGVRTWTILFGRFWAERTGEVYPDAERVADYWGMLRRFAEALKVRNLKWLVSQGDLMRWQTTTDGRRAFMRRLAETLRNVGGVACGVDAGNETAWNGEADAGRLKAALDAFTDVLPLEVRTLTSPAGEEHANDYLVPGVLRDIHSSRGPWPMPARRVFNMGYEAHPRIYTVQSEGPGYGVQEYPGDNRVGHHVSATDRPNEWNDNDPEIGGTLAACHVIGKALYVWFCSPGVISDEPFTNYAAFTTVPALYRLFPRDVQSWRTFHGGEGRSFSVDRVLAVPEDDGLDVRCDHAASGSQRVCVAYGPPGSYELRVVNDFEGVLVHPGTLEETKVSWRKDQRVRLDWRRGRILIGHVS